MIGALTQKHERDARWEHRFVVPLICSSIELLSRDLNLYCMSIGHLIFDEGGSLTCGIRVLGGRPLTVS